MKFKRDKADIAWSKYIRWRDSWKCQRCKKQYSTGARGLECSHFHSRRKESVRFDDDNCCALCSGCHLYLTGNPLEHVRWYYKRLGKNKFEALEVRANIYQKKDRKIAYLIAKEKLKGVKK